MSESGILQDWEANKHDPKIQLVLTGFRVAQRIHSAPGPVRWLGIPYLVLYRVAVCWVLGIELHWSLEVGRRLRVYHGHGLVVHAAAKIGNDCVLRHATTLGAKEPREGAPGGAPRLGDRVDVGPHVVLGPITIGDDAVIGAGSVVTRDVEAGTVVAGNPARELSRIEVGAS